MITPRQPGSPDPAEALLPWGVARLRGASMRPTLDDADRVLVRYTRRPRDLRPGSVVLARWMDGTVVCKRLGERRTLPDGRSGWWLSSDNPREGVDSRHRGPVAEDAVRGVVVARLWPHPRRLRPRPAAT